MSSRHTPALLGGLFIGVLSSLPVVSAANLCCCCWVVIGGVLTVYLQQQRKETPIEASDAILGGLLAGLIGAVVTAVFSFALLSVAGTMWQDQVRNALESNPDVPPQVRDFVLNLISGHGVALLQLAITIPIYAIFSMLGALLGVAFFKKKTPPAAQA
jgi:hypothetical protein